MADMEYNYESLDKASCADSVVSGNETYSLDETCVQIKETGSPSTCENEVRPGSWISKHLRCLIIIMVGVGLIAVVVLLKFGHGQQKGQDDSPSIQPPLEQNQYSLRKILQTIEAPANSPIMYVVDHEASGCPESYCKRCSANVPDSLHKDENNNEMKCRSSCPYPLQYDELIEKLGKQTLCGRIQVPVDCCLLKSLKRESCENGGRFECFDVKEAPRCVCPLGWTGDTCATPTETQVNCSCYNKELIHNRELSGQRFLPECSSSSKSSPWEKCHMNKDKFNCICERTENNEEARNLTLPSCDVTADPHTSAADHILSGHLTTVLVLVLTVCIRNTD